MTHEDLLLDERAVARKLGVTVRMLQARRMRGGGPNFVKVGQLVRYRTDDVENWLTARLVRSTSQPTSADLVDGGLR